MMNRRKFLKAAAVITAAITATATATATASPLVGCEFEPRTKSKWIAFKDQMPKPTDKFEIKEKRTGTIKEGYVLEFDTTDDGPNIKIEGKEVHLVVKKQFIMHRITKNSAHVVDITKWGWRYI